MRALTASVVKVFAILLAAVAGLAIGIAGVISLEMRDLQADDAVLPDELKAAESVYRTAGPEAALPEFEHLAQQYREQGMQAAETVATRFIGEIQWRLGEFAAAEANLKDALEASTVLGNVEQQARVLNVLGLLEWDRGDYSAALDYFEAAGDQAAETGDARMEGAVLNNISLVHDELGEYRVSLEQYQRALDRYEGIDFPRGRGDTLGNIGGVHLMLGEYRQALDYYRQALAISEQLESVTSMSQDHGNIALCLLGLGDSEAALEHFDRATQLAEQAGSKQDVAYWIRGKANALIRQGRHDQGLALHRTAVETYQAIGARTEAVEAMYDLGTLYLVLGDSTSAAQWFTQSLELAREIGLERGSTLNLLALGDLEVRRQSAEAAAAFYGQAWQRADASGEAGLAAESLLRLAATHQEQGLLDEARQKAGEALEINRRIGTPYGTAEALFRLAELDRQQALWSDALAHYQAASEALPEVVDPELGWQIHYGKGLTLAEQDRLPEAITELEQAISYIESVRDRLEEQRFRAGYVQDKYQVYVDLVRFQLRLGKEEDAFSSAERLRSRSYLDLLESHEAAPLAAADRRATELRERIRQLRRALNQENGLPQGQQRTPAIQVYTEELLAAEQEYETLLASRQSTRPGSRTERDIPGYPEVRQRLQSGEVLVEYVVSADEVLIFALTREDIKTTASPLGVDDLHSKVELLRDLLRRPDSDRWQRPAASLARALIEPLRDIGVLNGTNHLYLVPHGSLNYLPFAMLPTGDKGERALIEDFTIAYLPTAAALLGSERPSHRHENLLAMAPARSRLRYAGDEASRVFEMFGADSRLAVGEAATESLFKNTAGNFDVLHLATHGYFNKLNPMLSGLELEADEFNDGLLELHEIVGLDLDADLVTLSACQTGMGSGHFAEIPAGDDFVGLNRAFLSAGSSAVMATLWEVDDASTAQFMQQFYARLRVSPNAPSKAGALAEAQRRLRQTKKYRHPYYWAPFVLMGASVQGSIAKANSIGV
jgi:CHAT domain-containing protein/tetratricopeptide (TPR) repeat protein